MTLSPSEPIKTAIKTDHETILKVDRHLLGLEQLIADRRRIEDLDLFTEVCRQLDIVRRENADSSSRAILDRIRADRPEVLAPHSPRGLVQKIRAQLDMANRYLTARLSGQLGIWSDADIADFAAQPRRPAKALVVGELLIRGRELARAHGITVADPTTSLDHTLALMIDATVWADVCHEAKAARSTVQVLGPTYIHTALEFGHLYPQIRAKETP